MASHEHFSFRDSRKLGIEEYRWHGNRTCSVLPKNSPACSEPLFMLSTAVLCIYPESMFSLDNLCLIIALIVLLLNPNTLAGSLYNKKDLD